MSNLPTELVLMIAQQAAETFTSNHRQTVINLAQTAHLIYDAVAPILYRIIVVGDDWTLVAELIEQTNLAASVCPRVERLMISTMEEQQFAECLLDVGSLRDVFPNLRSMAVYAKSYSLLDVASADLREVELLDRALYYRPRPLPASVVRATIYAQTVDDLARLTGVVQIADTLTHLAININTSSGVTLWPELEDAVLSAMLADLCSIKHLQYIGFRLSGKAMHEHNMFGRLVRIAKERNEHKLHAWSTCKDTTDWINEQYGLEREFKAGIDIWNQGIRLMNVPEEPSNEPGAFAHNSSGTEASPSSDDA